MVKDHFGLFSDPNPVYLYAVRNKETGKYFKSYYEDSVIPKTWSKLGAARGRLTWANRKEPKEQYEVVKFQLKEVPLE